MKRNMIKYSVAICLAFLFSQCQLPLHVAKVTAFDKDKILVQRNFCQASTVQGCYGYVEDYICVVEKTGDLTCADSNAKYKTPSTKEAF